MAKKIDEIVVDSISGNGIIDNQVTNVSGFYYDQELLNPLTRVTLHANKKYNPCGLTDEAGPWEKPPDPDPDDSDLKFPYDLTPIATSIFAEDFSFDIANSFSDFGGDPIGELWNSQAATAPYSEMVGNALKTIAAKTTEWSEKKEKESGGETINGKAKWTDVIAKVADFMGTAAKKNANYHSRALHVNGTQFSYYSGSGISFNNMSMKFTLLSDWDNGKFKSVIYKLTDNDGWPLLAYVIGDYIPVTEIGKDIKEVNDFISKYASWQLPPGGFKANLVNVDTVNEGTLKLRFGPYFSIPNLIISGCSISMSKEMVRNPEGSPEMVPMSCDVTLQFKPAANFSKKTLMNILGVMSGDNGVEPKNSKYFSDVISKKNFNNVQ